MCGEKGYGWVWCVSMEDVKVWVWMWMWVVYMSVEDVKECECMHKRKHR